MTHIGIVVPLPLVPCGAAESMATSLPYVEKYAQVTCFVENVDDVSPELRQKHDIRSYHERDSDDIDVLIYHIGNNPHHKFVFDAIMEGPAGITEVHDGSLHHFIQDHYLGRSQQPFRYAEFGEISHGYAGRRLAEMRNYAFRGTLELFLYDYLQTALDRSRGVIVHSEYAKSLVSLRCPRVPVWTVPLHAFHLDHEPVHRAFTGVENHTMLIAHCGFVTLPKRPVLYLEAFRRALDKGLDAHFAFVGKDETHGLLQRTIARLDLARHVTITGYLETEELEQWVQAVDVIVNLRAPHVGESSGSLSYGLAAGKPVIVQPVGSWAEFPEDAVVRLPVTDDDTDALARTFFALGQDARLRRRFGEAAQRYARTYLDPDRCARKIADVATDVAQHQWTPPGWEWPSRIASVRMFHESGTSRIRHFLAADNAKLAKQLHEVVRQITPARPNAELLAIDTPDSVLQLLGSVYGYTVDARTVDAASRVVSCEKRPGIEAFSATLDPFVFDKTTVGRYDVIVAMQPIGEVPAFLAWCNRVLTPQGLLVIASDAVIASEMEDAGFSTHLHRDIPGVALVSTDRFTAITAGTKATLPLNVSQIAHAQNGGKWC